MMNYWAPEGILLKKNVIMRCYVTLLPDEVPIIMSLGLRIDLDFVKGIHLVEAYLSMSYITIYEGTF